MGTGQHSRGQHRLQGDAARKWRSLAHFSPATESPGEFVTTVFVCTGIGHFVYSLRGMMNVSNWAMTSISTGRALPYL